MNIVKSLTLLASIGFFTVPAYSQILTVGANCTGRDSKNHTLSVAFDSVSRKIMFYTKDLSVENGQDYLTSSPITEPPQFEDKNNPLKIVSARDQTINYVQFTSKGSIKN